VKYNYCCKKIKIKWVLPVLIIICYIFRHPQQIFLVPSLARVERNCKSWEWVHAIIFVACKGSITNISWGVIYLVYMTYIWAMDSLRARGRASAYDPWLCKGVTCIVPCLSLSLLGFSRWRTITNFFSLLN
jgi:hypothetical protein